jgi:hypothetical protein
LKYHSKSLEVKIGSLLAEVAKICETWEPSEVSGFRRTSVILLILVFLVVTSHPSSHSSHAEIAEAKVVISSSSTLLEEHGEDLAGINAHSTHILTVHEDSGSSSASHVPHVEGHSLSHVESSISFEVHSSAVVLLPLFGIGKDSFGVGNIFEFFGSLLLLDFAFGSVSVGMIFEG